MKTTECDGKIWHFDSHYRGVCASERVEQINSMSWLEYNFPDRWPLCMHYPAETRGTALHMALRKKEGVRQGVADILDIGAPMVGAFELKRLDKTQSKVSRHQEAFLKAVADSGGFSAICYGFEQFKLAYADYVALCFAQQGIK